MKGILASIDGLTITLSHDDTGDPDTTHTLAKKASVARNKKACKLSDLQPGDEITLSSDDPVTTVTAVG